MSSSPSSPPSSLNVLCAICSEFFQSNDIIFGTRCGHIFHKHCLFQWLQRSTTCPQCRRQCYRHLCHQIFLNFMEPVQCDGDIVFELPKSYEWIYLDYDIDYNDIFEYAIKFGQNEDGNDIYAARGRYNGDLIPGYYVPEKRGVVVPWGFKSHFITDEIELLDISNDDAEYKWVAASNGDIPENAFDSGRTAMGDALYTARAEHEGRILYGKLHQRYNMAYMPYKELEVCNSQYEVLVRIPKTPLKTKPSSSSTDDNDDDVNLADEIILF